MPSAIAAPLQRHLVELLACTRLVTVIGPGGVGKTRLVMDVARRAAQRHARGAVVVELARVTDEAGVASSIAAALDHRGGNAAEPSRLRDAGALDVLVILDNCEHVIDSVAGAASRMLAGGDHLLLLATSREPIAIDDEHVVALGPLGIERVNARAPALFRQRAAAAAPDVSLTDDVVVDLVAELDGLGRARSPDQATAVASATLRHLGLS